MRELPDGRHRAMGSDVLNNPGPGNLRDAELMVLADQGDRAAWQALYIRHRERVFRIALRFLGEEAGARDVTQEVFVSLFARARYYRPTASFPSYLRRVTVNRCINARASTHRTIDSRRATRSCPRLRTALRTLRRNSNAKKQRRL